MNMLGSFVFVIGIGLLIMADPGFWKLVGLIMIPIGAYLFWKTSATKRYLDQQKRERDDS